MNQETVSLADARRVIEPGEAKAVEIDQPIAINNAYTARAFDLPTADLVDLPRPGGQFYGVTTSNDGKVFPA